MRFKRSLRNLILWAAVILLLWFALRDVDWAGVGTILGSLSIWQILAIMVVNIGIFLLICSRWWLILRAQGYHIPFFTIAAYRLASFSVSYFTPGPQFGGEPLQVYLLSRRHNIPTDFSTASVLLDKILEVTSNFAFLAFGLTFILSGSLLKGTVGIFALVFSLILLALPLFYLSLVANRKTPMTMIASRIPWPLPKIISWQKLVQIIENAENVSGEFVKKHKSAFNMAVLLSGLIWSSLIFEFGLVIHFLGQHLTLLQVISVITAARIAILLPMPGGLGTLEAALIFVSQAMNSDSTLGASLSILIRARDIIFGLCGIWIAQKYAKNAMQITE